MAKLFIGIDWGSKTHSVCIVDADGKKVWEGEVAHCGDDVLAFVDRLLPSIEKRRDSSAPAAKLRAS